MAQVAARPTTAEELLGLPDDGLRRELVEGRVHEMVPAGAEHGEVAARIGALLLQEADRQGGRAFAAETGFVLARDPDTVRAPDAAYVTAEHARRVGQVTGYWPGAPDLAVEVVSPGDTYSQVHGKALAWLAAGTALVLVADPAARRVTGYRRPAQAIVFEGDQPVDCAPVLPGFAPLAGSLFPVRA